MKVLVAVVETRHEPSAVVALRKPELWPKLWDIAEEYWSEMYDRKLPKGRKGVMKAHEDPDVSFWIDIETQTI